MAGYLSKEQMDDALCATSDISPDAWTNTVPIVGRNPRTPQEQRRKDPRVHPERGWARIICAACPIVEECRDVGGYGSDAQPGMWGGLDEVERAEMTRPRR